MTSDASLLPSFQYLLITSFSLSTLSLTGSKDNVSAVVVQLPGAPKGNDRDNNIRMTSTNSMRSRVDSKCGDDEGVEEMGSPPDRNL